MSEAISGDDISLNLRDFNNLMDTVCDPLFTKKINVNKSSVDSNSSLSNKQPWFYQDCAEARKQFYAVLDQFRLDKILQNLRMIKYRNENIIMCSFKSSGDIQKKEGGPDRCFG